MDNLPAQKTASVRAAIAATAKLKTLLRQAPERTIDGLWRRIGTWGRSLMGASCDVRGVEASRASLPPT
jgi:muconolactone delta-isomerase